MKLSSKQTNLLAREIVKRLQAVKVQKISESLRTKINDFVNERDRLSEAVNKAQEQLLKHKRTLKVLLPGVDVWESETAQNIVKKAEEKNIPRVGEIEDAIILKSMFESADDMEKFIEKIVASYTKKLQSKVLNN